MASLGSLPFTIEAKTESSMFVLSKNYNRSFCSLKPQNQKPAEGLALLGDKMIVRSGKWPKPMQARAAISDSSGQRSDDPDEAIQATIEKSKKVLAMQQQLLEQVFCLLLSEILILWKIPFLFILYALLNSVLSFAIT